jgi:transcription elongation factor Elf1
MANPLRVASAPPDDVSLVVDCPFCGHGTSLTVHDAGLPAMAECDDCDVLFDFSTEEVYAAPSPEPATPIAIG